MGRLGTYLTEQCIVLALMISSFCSEYIASHIAPPPPEQGISYTFKNMGPDNYRASTRSGILAANDAGIVPSNEVIQPSIPMTSESYYQQGHIWDACAEPFGPSGMCCKQCCGLERFDNVDSQSIIMEMKLLQLQLGHLL